MLKMKKKDKPPESKAPSGSRFPVVRWVALVFLLPAVIYFAWVFGQLREIEERNLRILGQAADRIAGSLQLARKNVESLGEGFESILEVEKRQPYLWLDPGRDRESLEAMTELRTWEEAAGFLDERPEYEVTTYFRSDDEGVSLHARAVPRTPLPAAVQEFQKSLEEFRKSLESAAADDEDEDLERTLTQVSDLAASVVPRERAFQFRVDADALLDESASGEAFERLILVSALGNALGQRRLVVQYEDRPGAHRVLNLGQLAVEGGGWLGQGDEPKRQELDVKALQGASSVRRVILTGQRFDLYCQPFRLEGFNSVDNTTTWSVCGLVSPKRSLRQALVVAPHLAVALFLFLILGLLTWPFTKLVLMRRRERLRFADAYLLLAATFAFLLVVPVLLLDADSYVGLRGSQRELLKSLAGEIDARLHDHVRELYEEVDRYDSEICVLSTSMRSGELRRIRDVQLFRPASERVVPKRYPTGMKASRERSLVGKLPAAGSADFVSVFWMDQVGMQIAKATIRDHNTPPVDLFHRQYFQAIRDDAGWESEFGTFYYQTYRSATTGERSTALSVLSRLSDRSGDCEMPEPGAVAPESSYVAAITSRPLWLLEPVLPPGVAFAIVDESGRSLFHSVGSRALVENLFDELSSHRRLRSAMSARSRTHFGGRYRTRPHLGFVQPAQSAPWWIVTMADAEMVGALNIEALAQAAIGAIWYGLGLNLVFLFFYCVTRRRGGVAWLWPDREKSPLYRRLFWASLMIAVVFSYFVYQLEGEALQGAAYWMLPATIVIIVLLIVSWWAVSNLSKRLLERMGPTWRRLILSGAIPDLSKRFLERVRPSWDRLFRQRGEVSRGQLRWHLACVSALWLLAAVLPGIALFKAAWDDQGVAMVKLEGVRLAGRLGARAAWLENEWRTTAFVEEGENSRENILTRRWEELSALHRSASFFRTGFAGTGDGESSADRVDSAPGAARGPDPAEVPLTGLRMGDRLARFKPIYNPTVGGLRHLRGADSAHRKYEWRLVGDEVTMAASLPATLDLRSSWSPRPRIRVGWIAVLGWAVVLVALLIWVRWSALRIFFARIASRVGERGYTLEALEEIDRPVIALVPSPTDRRHLVTSGNRTIVDLAPADHQETELRISRLREGARRQVVCVNFGDALENPDERRWKLTQLESLVYDKRRRVVLRTAVSPLEDLFWSGMTREAREEPAPGESPREAPIRLAPVEAQRWGRLLSKFVVYPVTAKPPTVEGKEDLERLFETGLPGGLGRRREALERRLELFEGHYWALWTSCSPDERLVLVHLAQENFVNPKQESTVRRLLQKGLLKREPRLQLMDEAFELFVRRIHEPVEISRWERSGQGLGWQQFRWALFSLLAVLAAFLIATQQELVDVTLGFLSALVVGGLPGIIEIASRLRRSAGPGAAG